MLGTVRVESEGEVPVRRLLEVAGTEQRFLLVDLSEQQRETIDRLAGTGAELRVRGEVHFHADEHQGLRPDEIEKVE